MMAMARTLRIVVADDEIDIRDYFEKLLPRLGHVLVGLAENGQQLVELCESERPDLVITDVMMPEMDGFQAAEKIAESQSVPIIVVSSHERSEFPNNALIVDYLLKPVSMYELEIAIDRAVSH